MNAQMVLNSYFEMLMMMLFGGGFGMPTTVPPMEPDVVAAHVAPAECLAYVSWAGTAKPEASSENHTEQLLAEEEVQKFLNSGMDRLTQMMGMQGANDPQAAKTIEDILKLTKLIQGKPGAIYVSDFEFNGRDAPTIRGGGLIRVDDDAKAVKEVMQRLQEQVKGATRVGKVTSVKVAGHEFWKLLLDDDVPPFCWGIVGKYLVLGIGDGSAEKLVGRMDGPTPKWLDEIHAKLPVPRVATVSYIDVGRIVGLIEKIAEMEHSPEVGEFISSFGLDKLETLVSVSGMDAKGCVTRTLVTVDGPGTGMLKWIEAKPLTPDDLDLIGRESPVAIALKLDPVQVYDAWIEMLETVEPREAKWFKRDIEAFKQEVGVEIRGDLLKSIGGTWRLFTQPGPEDMLAGWTLAVDVRDHKKLLATQETIVKAYLKVMKDAPPGAPTIETKDIDGLKIHTMDLSRAGLPVAPSWCVTEKYLLVTLNPGALKKLLGNQKNQPSLAQVPEVAPEVADDSRTLGLVYLDTKKVARALLPQAEMGLQMLAREMGLPFQVDTSNLPSADMVIDHLQPTTFVLRRTDDGIELESRRTLPGPNIATMAPSGMVGFLSAIVPARHNMSRRARSSNNMRQIVLALHIFHEQNRAFPAGYSADKKGKPLLSWRVHILPYIGEDNLYKQFHLDEPWDSEHNKTLIEKMPNIFRSPDSEAKQGTTKYLGVGGADGVFVRPKAGGKTGTTTAQITDGASKTVMVVEVPDKFTVTWTRPADFSPTDKNLKERLFGEDTSTAVAGFADGHVTFLGNSNDPKALKGLFTKSGGE